MGKEIVKVGVANEGEQNIDVEVVKLWEPKNINSFGVTTFFSVDGKYLSMTREDFKKIFNK